MSLTISKELGNSKINLSRGFQTEENSQIISEYREMVLPLLKFMVDFIINLMSGPYHKC